MKIKFIVFNKSRESWVAEAQSEYLGRLKRYVPFELIELDSGKKSTGTPDQLKKEEARKLMSRIRSSDYLVLLDERGKKFASVDWAQWIDKRMGSMGTGDLVFIAGGPYGFDEEVYCRSQERLSLSDMTFTHQMVKVIFLEQLYRAMTILRNEPYHHE